MGKNKKKKRILQSGKPVKLSKNASSPVIRISRTDITSQQDATFVTAPGIKAVLDSTETGKFKTWADFITNYIKMDGDIAFLVEQRKNDVSSKDLLVEPIHPDFEPLAEFIQKTLNDIPTPRCVWNHLLEAVFSGAEIAEMLWTAENETDPEAVLWKVSKIIPRDLRKFARDQQLGWYIDDIESPGNTDHLSDYPTRFLIHTPGELNSLYPEQAGLYRVLVKWSWIKRKVLELQLIALRRGSAGGSVLFVAPGTEDEHMGLIKADLDNMSFQDNIVVKSPGDVKALNQGISSADHQAIIELAKRTLSQIVTGGTLNAGTDTNASFALGSVHERRAKAIAEGDAEKLADVIKNQLVRAIIIKNRNWLRKEGILLDDLETIPVNVYFNNVARAYNKITQMHINAGIISKNDLLRDIDMPTLGPEGDVIIPGVNELEMMRLRVESLTKEIEKAAASQSPIEEPSIESIDEAAIHFVVRKTGSQYCIYSEAGEKLECFLTKAEAEDRLQQIEQLKHIDETQSI